MRKSDFLGEGLKVRGEIQELSSEGVLVKFEPDAITLLECMGFIIDFTTDTVKHNEPGTLAGGYVRDLLSAYYQSDGFMLNLG